jgi:hypothetical protein
MSDTPILSVVRVKARPKFLPFKTSFYNGPNYATRYSEIERRAWYDDRKEEIMEMAGKYVKSGGGGYTANLQEAQIFGWSRRAKENLSMYAESNGEMGEIFEILPVLITIPEN